MPKRKSSNSRRLRARAEDLSRAIDAMDLAAPGSMNLRTKVCGKPTCRCAAEDGVRHGPYYEWARYEEGRLTHRIVTADQAAAVKRAIENYREIEDLLARWVIASVEKIVAMREKG
jgi:hypothetical protein